MLGEAAYDASRLVPVHAFPGADGEDRTFGALADGEIHDARCAGCERDDDGSASFAVHPQRVMATFESEVVDVGVEHLGHP